MNTCITQIFDACPGHVSTLAWGRDQYRVTRVTPGNSVSDPNRMDDEEYIVRLAPAYDGFENGIGSFLR